MRESLLPGVFTERILWNHCCFEIFQNHFEILAIQMSALANNKMPLKTSKILFIHLLIYLLQLCLALFAT